MTRHKTRALKKLETDLQKLELREVVSNAVRDLATPVIGIEFESSSSPDSLGTSRAKICLIADPYQVSGCYHYLLKSGILVMTTFSCIHQI